MYPLINTHFQLNAATILFSHHLETYSRNRNTKGREIKKQPHRKDLSVSYQLKINCSKN
jgi:hypothetical protein